MAKISTSVSLDKDNREKGQEVFESLGLDMSTAVNIFLAECVRRDGIPFPVNLGKGKSPAAGFKFSVFQKTTPLEYGANRVLASFCDTDKNDINPALLRDDEIMILLDTAFGIASELYACDSAYAHALIMGCLPEGNEYPSVDVTGGNFFDSGLDRVPNDFSPYGECAYVFNLENGEFTEFSEETNDLRKQYSVSAYTNSIVAVVQNFIGRDVTAEELLKMLCFGASNVYTLAAARSYLGAKNGRNATVADDRFHCRCLMEEMAALHPLYTRHALGYGDSPMFNKGEHYAD